MTGVVARDIMDAAVRRELFGPVSGAAPQGKPLDCSSGSVSFVKKEDSWGAWHDSITKEEILTQSDPLRRYGIGVLFPGAASSTAAGSRTTDDVTTEEADLTGMTGLSMNEGPIDGPTVEVELRDQSGAHGDVDSDDFDLTNANSFKPSAMAVSFQCDLSSGTLTFALSGAYYDRITAKLPTVSKPRTWWVRRPVELTATIDSSTLLGETGRLVKVSLAAQSQYRVTPTLQVYCRRAHKQPSNSSHRIVTMAILNTTTSSGPASALFQVGFRVTGDDLPITPYPDAETHEPDAEEQSIALLYRRKRTFAIGHGCSANWELRSDEVATSVWADPLPAYEVPNLTPNVFTMDMNGRRKSISVGMDELASGSDTGNEQVETVLRLYGDWINARSLEIAGLPIQFQSAAVRHVRLCGEALSRMQAGWQMVKSEPIASKAFRLANKAMLFQQIRSSFDRRPVERKKDGTLYIPTAHPAPTQKPGVGQWRPFQIAFILATLPELVDRTAKNRETVDLIFFPTGGGKTEAYLGASAVSLLARRLRDKRDSGTDTLMRYTLRLLTAQQFLRAASLICVLEDIRSDNENDLGSDQFGIGVWLGGTSTPNRWPEATANVSALARDTFAQNKFLLLRCPWCGTQMGPKAKPRGGQDVIGYEVVGKKVELRCLDNQCRFGGRKKLPVHVVDTDIYETRPSIVIGTVDKFAMLAWRPEARALFGISNDGSRAFSPPGLIIQDELHLISGPLGSMVGLYEPVVEDLCTDKRTLPRILPKIIASTATIRQYEEQIRGLFGRNSTSLFPPHGLEEGRSFFAEPELTDNGTPTPGRRYLGIMSASLGSTQTVQVRVAAATLQGAYSIPEADRDGYWTNVNFLNSLRELGNTVSLIQSDIPDYLTGLRRRDNIRDVRWPRIPMELTGRRRADDIPKAIEQLQLSYGESGCVDICLASNIIEVGVDINRLALMTIVGQPKTTAQYIQVSGRVGRRADVSPGLVLTIYGAAKPRDRSHYERFRTYHQSLYAQVEPTSVTPFATPVLRRAMHAAVVAHIRQTSPSNQPAYPFPEVEYLRAVELLLHRAAIADSDERETLASFARTRSNQWNKWQRTQWSANVNGGDPKQGLMRFAGTLPDLKAKATIWDVPTSMRNVDAECRLEISTRYIQSELAADSEPDK